MKLVRKKTTIVALVLLVASAAAGCSTRSTDAARPGTDLGVARNALPGLGGRTCSFTSRRDALPPFMNLARLGTRGNIAIWGFSMDASDSATISVRYDEEGRLAWVRAIQSSMDPARVGPLERLLAEALHEEGPTDWGVRLRVVGGDIASIEPSVICPAEPRNALRDPGVVPASTLREYRRVKSIRGRYFPLQITINADGRPVQVRMARSTGDGMLDQYLTQWVHDTDFHPKVHDGIQLASTFEKTIYVPRYQR